MTIKYDLLTDSVVSWRGRNRLTQRGTLPALLAALAGDEVMDFPLARAHQQQPWSMFLTQLAAIALHRAGSETPSREECDWTEKLLRLTNGAHEPWCLLVEDLSKPAFFQPPIPEKVMESWKVVETPDDLDLLVTAKCHDIKKGLISADTIEAWVYALCTVQTTQGFPGRGYNGIARMNGGYGNRPRVGLSPGPTHGERFSRDVHVLLAEWPELLARGFANEGVALVWCQPWDGKTSIPLASLAPHFIEACQRVRFAGSVDGLIARRTTTSARFCASDVDGGDVGDCWCPVDREKGSILTPGSRGFDYKLMAEMLFGGQYAPAPAQRQREFDSNEMLFCASALVRGQGKTEGLHERLLPIPGKVRNVLLRPKERESLGRRALDRVKDAARMRSKVLYPALKLLALGEMTPADALDTRVDERFFDALFSSVGETDDTARTAWEDELARFAMEELALAIERTPLPESRYWRVTSAARSMFFGCLMKQFPDVSERRDQRTHAQTLEPQASD